MPKILKTIEIYLVDYYPSTGKHVCDLCCFNAESCQVTGPGLDCESGYFSKEKPKDE